MTTSKPSPPKRLRCRHKLLKSSTSRLWLTLKNSLRSMLVLIWRAICSLQLVSAIVNNRKMASEPMKKATTRGRLSAASHSLAHLPSLAITSVLLCVNISGTYWDTIPHKELDINIQLNLLQVAAKAHEILIAISLGTIILHHIQYSLLRGAGVPLGSLFAGYQFTDISTLLTPAFWAPISSKGAFMQRLPFAILFLACILLGATTGPASAVLIMPSLDWWNWPLRSNELPALIDSTSNLYPTSNVHLYLAANESALWPSRISDVAGLLPSDCTFANLSAPEACPTSNLLLLASLFRSSEFSDSESLPDTWNISLPLGSYLRYLQGSMIVAGDNITYSLTQTTYKKIDWILKELLFFLPARDLLVRYSISLFNSTKYRLPLVPRTIAKCESHKFNLTNITAQVNEPVDVIWRELGGRDISLSGVLNLTIPDTVTLESLSNDSYFFQWEKLSGDDASIMAKFVQLSTITGINDTVPTLEVGICPLYASWERTQSYVDNTETIIHSPDVSDLSAALLEWVESDQENLHQQIDIDLDWANAAFPPDQAIQYLIGTQPDRPTSMIALVLSVIFTNAISGIGYEYDTVMSYNFTNPTPGPSHGPSEGVMTMPSSYFWSWETWPRGQGPRYPQQDNTTEISVDRQRFGYSYSMRGITRCIAVGILLSHMILALSHTAVTLWMGWSCDTYASLHEILVLALNTAPTTTLDNTCAGIARLDTYKHVARVREVPGKADPHLELVLNEERESWKVEGGKIYGSLGILRPRKKLE